VVRVTIENLSKRFGDVGACNSINLSIQSGELLTLLGPSGCGKTTTLNCVAGFIEPDSGDIRIDDASIVNVSPHKRNLGMCFQTWALWPHMTVYDNVAFGLRTRKTQKDKITPRVNEVLQLVKLSGLEKRFPRQLSGGQQQRVALARALVINPRVLLLDEPLSNLDAKLRQETRVDVKQLIKRLRITTIYVTHDQEEALEISDRVAVMNKGEIKQIGSPNEIYQRPEEQFVADFMGENNTLSGSIVEILDASVVIEASEGFRMQAPKRAGFDVGSDVTISIRPEDITLNTQTEPGARNMVMMNGEIAHASFRGAYIRYIVSLKSGTLIKANSTKVLGLKDKVNLAFAQDKCLVLKRG
jgi:spermidine/putrescine ABC transporter ATP-binding subunit